MNLKIFLRRREQSLICGVVTMSKTGSWGKIERLLIEQGHAKTNSVDCEFVFLSNQKFQKSVVFHAVHQLQKKPL